MQMDICLGSPSPLNDESAKKVNSQDQAESQKILRLLLHSVTSLGDFLGTVATSSSFGPYFFEKKSLRNMPNLGRFYKFTKVIKVCKRKKIITWAQNLATFEAVWPLFGSRTGSPCFCSKNPQNTLRLHLST